MSGEGMSCFLAVDADSSGNAREIGLSLASAIGADKAGIYETTFADETMGDLFGEQILLVGGLAGLTMAVFQTMIDHKIPPENAYLETIHQLSLLASMIEEFGPEGMIERVSKTAAFGSLKAMDKLFDADFRAKLTKAYANIESGEFNRELMSDAALGFPTLQELLKKAREHQSQMISTQFSRRRKST